MVINMLNADFFYRIIKYIYSPPSSINRVTRRNYKLLSKWISNKDYPSNEKGENAFVVDLGGGNGGRGSEKFFSEIKNSHGKRVCIDIKIGSKADILCDIHDLAIASETSDLVILQGVLEHVEDERRVLEEASRILMKKGLVYIEIPFIQGYHADPEDYRRLTEPGLVNFVKKAGFEIVSAGPTAGPGAAITAVLRKGILGFFKKGVLRHIFTVIVRWALLPLLIIDMAVDPEKNSEISHGYYCIARKNV